MFIRRDFTSANSLKLEYLPLARNGCANISSVRFGVKVMLTRVSIEKVFCCSRPKMYRVPAKPAGALRSGMASTYCWAVLSMSSDGESVSSTRDDGLRVTDGKYDTRPPSVL